MYQELQKSALFLTKVF